jgi:hypothetical protein
VGAAARSGARGARGAREHVVIESFFEKNGLFQKGHRVFGAFFKKAIEFLGPFSKRPTSFWGLFQKGQRGKTLR